MDGTVREILGYPATFFRPEASIPDKNAPIKAATAGASGKRSKLKTKRICDSTYDTCGDSYLNRSVKHNRKTKYATKTGNQPK